MPLLSRVARVSQDYRAARASVALLGGVGAALSPLSAVAQDKTPGSVQTAQMRVGAPVVKANFVKPPMALGPHCDVIKAAFELVEFDGDYAKHANTWLASKCQGDVPLPEPGTNMKRFNAAGGVLARKFDIHLTP